MRLCAMGIDIRGFAAERSALRPAAGGATASGAAAGVIAAGGAAAGVTAAGEAAAAMAAGRDPASAEAGVTALFEAHSLGLTRLAHIMLGDRSGAEDVVQEAFCGLYRRWPHLSDQAKALPYLRSCVLNGCRTVLRRTRPRDIEWGDQPHGQPGHRQRRLVEPPSPGQQSHGRDAAQARPSPGPGPVGAGRSPGPSGRCPRSVPPPAVRHPCQTQPWTCRAGA